MAAELRASRIARNRGTELIHIAFIENNLRLLARHWARGGARCVGTAHQPAGWWRTRHRHPEIVAGLDALIVTSSELKAYFEEFLPGRVHLVLHGADTDFFRPAPDAFEGPVDPPRCLFSGVWLRDLTTLERVIDRVVAKHSEIRFDLVVPTTRRDSPELQRIGRHNRVAWHTDLPDTALRDLYGRASMLLLPLLDSAANTTLVESIACGLPVITTDVGGAHDYTDPSFADLLPPGDVDGTVDAVLRLAEDREAQCTRSRAARAFAERVLPWQPALERTTEIYRDVLGRVRATGSTAPAPIVRDA